MTLDTSRGAGFPAFLDWLETRGILTPEAARRARNAQASTAQPADTVLIELGLTREADLARHMAAFLGVGTAEVAAGGIDPELLSGVGQAFLESNHVLPLRRTDAGLVVAVADPFARGAVEVLSYQFDLPASVEIAPRSAIVEAIRALGAAAAEAEATPAADAGTETDDIERLRDSAREAPIIRFVAQVIQTAVDGGATDIHVEPGADRVRIRFRRDGMLEAGETAPKAMQAGIATRIKILARLNIAERRLPQDGRMRVAVRGQEIDLRVSVLPSVHGESFVLRILDRSGVTLSLDALGYDADAIVRFRRLAHLPNGIVLLTGPTGSGKTTTLYSVLGERRGDPVKVFTVEDPVEYRVDGITQLQIDPAIDLSFARALRSVLRHDPDIILIGEIRDRETAQIAIQAALTGHLVFSTLHTNSAAGALTRLLDMGIDGYLIGATVRAVAAQRLLRRICPDCGGAATVDGRPCPGCRGFGYAGRRVTYEIMELTPELTSMISGGATEAALHARAVAERMQPMSEHAARLVREGMTDPREVRRVLELGRQADDDSEVATRIYFKAYRSDGEIESGHLDARDEQEAMRLLRQSGRVPFELSAAGSGLAAAPRRPARWQGRGPDPARLLGDLSVMLNAGFTIDVALRAVAEAATDRRQARAAEAIHARISEGQSVAEAFAAVPDLPAGVPALLASGESSGRLDAVVASLADSYARAAARRREVLEALLYPAFLIVVMFGAFLLLALYLAPALQPVFENAGVAPPALVRGLTAAGTLLTRPGPVGLGVLALLVLVAVLALRPGAVRDRLGELSLRLPGVSGFRRSSAAGRYLATMALLVGNGVPMLEAMRLGADTAATPSGRAALLAARQSVADGRSLWEAIAASGQFPDFVVSLVRLGEQSDNLAPMLSRAGAIVEAQLQRRLSRLLTFLTPAITLLLGLVVGGLVVSVMSTLLSINEIALQ